MTTVKVDTVGYKMGGVNSTTAPADKVEASAAAAETEDISIEIADESKGSMAQFTEGQGNSKTANEEIRKKVDQINKEMLEHDSELIFGIHDETNRVMIKVVDRNTKKVIKEYPPEKTLDMLAKVWEVAGLMVDEKR